MTDVELASRATVPSLPAAMREASGWQIWYDLVYAVTALKEKTSRGPFSRCFHFICRAAFEACRLLDFDARLLLVPLVFLEKPGQEVRLFLGLGRRALLSDLRAIDLDVIECGEFFAIFLLDGSNPPPALGA